MNNISMPVQPTLTNTYQVLFNDVDFTGRLKLSALFNYFQELAGQHAVMLGVGHDDTVPYGVIFVLTRMRVDLVRYPTWEEEVTVETWPQLPGRYEFFRDYLMRDRSGQIIARGVSSWVLIDIQSRKLKKAATIPYRPEQVKQTRAIECTLGKIKPPSTPQQVYRRMIGCSDIDLNGHLNNSKYLDFIVDCFTVDQLKKYQATSITVNFLNEVFPGETLIISRCGRAEGEAELYVEGTGEESGKPAFVAELVVEARK